MKRFNFSSIFSCFLLVISHVTFADELLIPKYSDEREQKCSCNCGTELTTLLSAKVTNENIGKWSKQAAIDSFTYGFGNYNFALKRASRFFTEQGWKMFRDALSQSHNLEAVIKNNLIVSATLMNEPRVSNMENQKGIKTWNVILPIKVEYQGFKHNLKQFLLLNLTVVQDKPELGMEGIGINIFSARPYQAT